MRIRRGSIDNYILAGSRPIPRPTPEVPPPALSSRSPRRSLSYTTDPYLLHGEPHSAGATNSASSSQVTARIPDLPKEPPPGAAVEACASKSCGSTPRRVTRRVSVGLVKLREIEQEDANAGGDAGAAQELAQPPTATHKFSQTKSLFEDLARTDKWVFLTQMLFAISRIHPVLCRVFQLASEATCSEQSLGRFLLSAIFLAIRHDRFVTKLLIFCLSNCFLFMGFIYFRLELVHQASIH